MFDHPLDESLRSVKGQSQCESWDSGMTGKGMIRDTLFTSPDTKTGALFTLKL